jgi:hypothetical protein
MPWAEETRPMRKGYGSRNDVYHKQQEIIQIENIFGTG